MGEGSDKPKVEIASQSTKVTSGTAVQEKLIVAARVFSDLLKPTYGPRGLDKMLSVSYTHLTLPTTPYV